MQQDTSKYLYQWYNFDRKSCKIKDEQFKYLLIKLRFYPIKMKKHIMSYYFIRTNNFKVDKTEILLGTRFRDLE